MTSVAHDPRLHDIYRMRDLSGRLLYIGVTNGGLRRFMQHAKDKTWWREVAQIDIEHVHCSRQVIESIEREAIRTERPLYNVAHNVGHAALSGNHQSIDTPARQLPPPPPTNPPTPAQVIELVGKLDELGVPDSASVRQARMALRSSGVGARHLVLVSAQRHRGGRAEHPRPDHPKPQPPSPPTNDAMWKGDIVRHPAFGEGCVLGQEGFGDHRHLTIQFDDNVGTKVLAAKWAPLKLIKVAGGL